MPAPVHGKGPWPFPQAKREGTRICTICDAVVEHSDAFYCWHCGARISRSSPLENALIEISRAVDTDGRAIVLMRPPHDLSPSHVHSELKQALHTLTSTWTPENTQFIAKSMIASQRAETTYWRNVSLLVTALKITSEMLDGRADTG